MEGKEVVRISYMDSAKAELARIRLLLEDLKMAETDTFREINTLEEKLTTLNTRNNRITHLLNQKLRPHAAELRAAVAEFKRIQELRCKLDAISYMSIELGTDVYQKENEEEEKVEKFDARKTFDKEIWKALSDQLNKMIKICQYTGLPESYLNIDTSDVVVGGRHKKNQGKGYRAFLNTLMLFNVMKYLETKGKYASHFLILDSPILSLKEKKYNITEAEKATAGMRAGLIRYIIENCGQNQVIIAENELPENVDYSKAHLITFSQEEGEGLRYGFLKSHKNS